MLSTMWFLRTVLAHILAADVNELNNKNVVQILDAESLALSDNALVVRDEEVGGVLYVQPLSEILSLLIIDQCND
ncbi:hypothetical protein V6N11_053980 [Hibiscus sabdariffa]|uniref:Uncharacterized protein n=1 Tax=Hibiscus sabdariffa TaxID=183260 RepID=A0ABR2S2T9_9ROSI